MPGGGRGFSSMDEALRTFMGAFGGVGGDSIFESFFSGGGAGAARMNRQGASKRVNMTLSFEEAASGVDKELCHHQLCGLQDLPGKGVSFREWGQKMHALQWFRAGV